MNIEETGCEIINLIFNAMKERRTLSNDERVHLDRMIQEVENEL